MIYKLKEQKDKFIEKIYKDSMKDLSKFYGVNWTYGRPNVIIPKSRKQIDQLKDTKTERWVVGWSSGQFIYVLDRKNYNKESSNKYSPLHYAATIKHELSHAFYNIKSKGKNTPRWLCEGVAIYTSGQNKFKKRPIKFSNFLDFYENGGREIYSESGFVVEILIKKYGKNKLLKLITDLNIVKSEKDFTHLFKKIYNFLPNYKEFNSLLDKTN
jgi:hypothetical protein